MIVRQLKSICPGPEKWMITFIRPKAHPLYRFAPPRTLTTILMGFSLLLTAGIILTNDLQSLADDDNDWNWPEQIYFPQHPSSSDAKASPEQSNGRGRGKKGGRKSASNKPPEKDGPRETLPSPYPLLRLAMPIMTDQGLVPSGIYLIKPAVDPDALPDEPPPNFQSSHITVALTHGERTIARVKLNHIGPVVSDLPVDAETPTQENSKPIHHRFHTKHNAQQDSPITSVHSKKENAPPIIKVESVLSADQKTLIILFAQGHNHFQSDLLPIMTEKRHQLTF